MSKTDDVVLGDQIKAHAALRRSMTLTRMLDYGMDHWDARALTDAPVTSSWDEVASSLASGQLERAEAARRRSDDETAVDCYRSATAALVFAQMAFNEDVAQKHALYAGMSASYQAAADIDTELQVRRLSVPFDGSSCTAWLVRRNGAAAAPAVVIVGGQSGWGPAYHRQAAALARRGLTAVLLEAPGQGETRLERGLHLDARVGLAFSATLDTVVSLTGFDGPCGVWGNSMGGLIAARGALADPRFGALCVNGAPARPEPAPFRTAREQSQAMLGVEGDDAVAAAFRELWVDPAVDRTAAAVLVLHGGQDPLITLDQQRPFLEISDDATLKVWEDGEHTIYNHSAERTNVVSDWFRAKLLPRPSRIMRSAPSTVLLHHLRDEMTIAVGGFGLCGIPATLIETVRDSGVAGLTIVSNNMGVDGRGLGLLLESNQVRRVIASYVGENRLFAQRYLDGDLEVEFTPQGTLAERMRAGGAGIPAFYTRTGVGTIVAEGKPTAFFDGVEHVQERAIVADLGLVHAFQGDTSGNLRYRLAARNFNPVVAACAGVTVAEVEQVMPALEPELVHTPGVYVTEVVHVPDPVKPIEQRTIRARSAGALL